MLFVGKVNLPVGLTKYHAVEICFVLNKAPHYEDVWVSVVIAPHILNLSARWRRVDSFTARPL